MIDLSSGAAPRPPSYWPVSASIRGRSAEVYPSRSGGSAAKCAHAKPARQTSALRQIRAPAQAGLCVQRVAGAPGGWREARSAVRGRCRGGSPIAGKPPHTAPGTSAARSRPKPAASRSGSGQPPAGCHPAPGAARSTLTCTSTAWPADRHTFPRTSLHRPTAQNAQICAAPTTRIPQSRSAA